MMLLLVLMLMLMLVMLALMLALVVTLVVVVVLLGAVRGPDWASAGGLEWGQAWHAGVELARHLPKMQRKRGRDHRHGQTNKTP